MCLLAWTDAECSSTVGRCPVLRHGGCSSLQQAPPHPWLLGSVPDAGNILTEFGTSNLCLPCQERPRNGWPFMCSNKWFATVSVSGFVAPLDNFRGQDWTFKPSLLLVPPLTHSTRLIHGKQTPTHRCVLITAQHSELSWNELHFAFP